jgi:hypothetical protein
MQCRTGDAELACRLADRQPEAGQHAVVERCPRVQGRTTRQGSWSLGDLDLGVGTEETCSAKRDRCQTVRARSRGCPPRRDAFLARPYPHPAVLIALWPIVDAGTALGLYDCAFATLAGLYERDVRGRRKLDGLRGNGPAIGCLPTCMPRPRSSPQPPPGIRCGFRPKPSDSRGLNRFGQGPLRRGKWNLAPSPKAAMAPGLP